MPFVTPTCAHSFKTCEANRGTAVVLLLGGAVSGEAESQVEDTRFLEEVKRMKNSFRLRAFPSANGQNVQPGPHSLALRRGLADRAGLQGSLRDCQVCCQSRLLRLPKQRIHQTDATHSTNDKAPGSGTGTVAVADVAAGIV